MTRPSQEPTPGSSPESSLRNKRALTIGAIVAAVAVIGVVILLMVFLGSDQTLDTDSGHEPAVTATAERSPTAAEISRLQVALASGEVALLAPYLGAQQEEIDEQFVSGVAMLGIDFTQSSADMISEGLFELPAEDKGGNAWRIGLHYEGEQLMIGYAEPL